MNPNYNPVNYPNLGNLIGNAKRARKKEHEARLKSEQKPEILTLKVKAEKAKRDADEKESIIDNYINSFEGIKPRECWKHENLTREFDIVDENGYSTDWYSGKRNKNNGIDRIGW
jgi:hypothetical protein